MTAIEVEVETGPSAAAEAADVTRNVGLGTGASVTAIDCIPGLSAGPGLNGLCLWDATTTAVGFGASFWPGGLPGALINAGTVALLNYPFSRCG